MTRRDSLPDTPTAPQLHRIVPLVVACPLFLQNLDTSVMSTALPSIAQSLNVQVLHLNLAITSYLLSLVIFLPASPWLAERFGPRRVFCAAIMLFSIGSTLCGMANSLEQLVFYRLLQGVGGALMVPVGRLILLRTIPLAQMVGAMVWFTVPGAIGRMVGPLFGGAIVTFTSWRWIFLINIPFGVLSVLAAWWFIRGEGVTANPDAAPPDLKGLAMLATALGGMLGAMEMVGKNMLPDSAIAAIGVTGVLALVAYLVHSKHLAAPVIDFNILRFDTYRAAVAGGMPLRIAIGASPFLMPLMLQLGFGLSPLNSGMLTMAMALGSLATRPMMTYAIRTLGFRKLLITFAVLTSAFYGIYSLFTPHTPQPLMFAIMLMGGLCSSMTMVVLNTMGYSDIPRDRMGHATALSSMAQQLSITLGVVAGATLVGLTHHLHGGVGILGPTDFAPTYVAIGVTTLISAFAFRRLPLNVGQDLRDPGGRSGKIGG
jgi:EmrB/QacA subfamily drug resistance transporter